MGLYIVVIVLSLIIGGLSTWYVNSSLKKYQNVPTSTGWTGYQAAKEMMKHYGIGDLPVQAGGEGQDHFDPRSNLITLSPSVFNNPSVTAVATACHEVGHACQFAQGYMPMKIRSTLVPIVNFTQGSWFIILMIGMLLGMMGLVDLAIAFYAVAVVFHLVTLPVELDASKRGLKYMEEIGIVEQERNGAKTVLRACALTYVAAALISIINLLYLIGAYRN